MYHYNHLGSTTAVTDQAGKLVYSYDYGTYGELTTTTEYSTIAPKVRFLYNGQLGVMTDDNTLYYMRQRYYNPQIKRFINQDILIGSIGNSASLNRYSYIEGNPISYTDPFGLSPFSYISQPLHRTLDWAGMLPIVGVGFDWINAGIYLMEGKPTYALFAAFSSIGIGDGVKFLIKNGKKSIAGISITALFCETDAGSGLKEDIGVLVDDYATYQGYDQMSKDELALTLTIDLVLGAKSGYDDLNIKKKKVDVDVDDFVPDNATSRLDKIDGDDLVPDNTSAVINRADVDNVVANTQGFGGCFVEGTEIKTIEGDKNIEDIHAGDMVYSKNTETGEEGYKEVVRVFKKKTYELVYLTVGDEEIITTPNHPFYVVDEGFVEAGNLQIGDEVETADGEILEIEAITIEYLDEPIQIYNFEVADWHTYYVSEEEVLVHNNCTRSNVDFVVSPNGVVEGVGNGQHVLEKHVGQTDSDLIMRMNNNAKISGASSFTDDIIANETIEKALNDHSNKKKIDVWLASGGNGKITIDYTGNSIVGRGIKRGDTAVRDMTNAKIVLKGDGKGGYDILTAFPQ